MERHRSRQAFKAAKRLVVKVGTSTITYENGRMNLRHMDRLCRALADQMNQGREVILVTSGAIAIGKSKLRAEILTNTIRERQAFASIGQCELMSMYDRLFAEYGYHVGQILLTRDDIEDPMTFTHITNTFKALLEKEVIPIVNENDSVSIREVYHNGSFGDNDALSAHVARMLEADLLILLSDIDGLYDHDPRQVPDARLIDQVTQLDESLFCLAGDSGSSRGTGGMKTKLKAAQIATASGIDMVIANGARPQDITDLLDGACIGTWFVAKR